MVLQFSSSVDWAHGLGSSRDADICRRSHLIKTCNTTTTLQYSHLPHILVTHRATEPPMSSPFTRPPSTPQPTSQQSQLLHHHQPSNLLSHLFEQGAPFEAFNIQPHLCCRRRNLIHHCLHINFVYRLLCSFERDDGHMTTPAVPLPARHQPNRRQERGSASIAPKKHPP